MSREAGLRALSEEALKGLKMDLITFQVLRNAFTSACYEASITVERVAYHPVVGMGRDRSNGLLTADGDLVAHGHTDAAAHYASFEPSVKELLKDVPKDEMQPGDAYLFSDPYRTGSHVNDTRLIKPIFVEDEVVAFACSVIHWPDMGGPRPGTFNPMATSCYAEGIRIPPIKLYENNKMVEPFWKFIAHNIRGAIERRGDVTAQFQAATLVEKRIKELAERYGVDTVKLAFEECFNYAERVMLSLLSEQPDGEWEFEDFGDRDVLKEGEPPIRVHCKMTKKGTRIRFDWSDSDPQPIASWGCTRATTLGGNYLGFMICFPELFPMNHGVIRNLEIITKPGTCVDVQFPAPTTGYCSGAFDKVESVTIGCLSQMLAERRPWRVYAGAVSLTNCCLGGYNPRRKREFVQYLYAVGGENARTFKDGKELIFMRFCNARTVPQELEERWFPILFTRYEARQDGCGHGKYRGGFPLVREFVVLADCELTIHGDRERFPPWGAAGGTNAGGCALILNKGTDKERNLGMYATGVRLKAGDRVYYTSSGGGGMGSPLERDPELVLKDVMDGYISLECARKFYGVAIKVIDEEACQYEVDWKETEKLREELKKRPIPEGYGPHQVHPMGKKVKPSRWMTYEEVQPYTTIARPPGW